MAISYSFADKRVLITGGGQGIGRQLVQRFYDGGATVFTIDKNPETIVQLREELPGVTAEIVDITDWAAAQEVVECFGSIDHLVNNAGVVVPQGLLEISEESAALHYNVNVGGAINMTQIVAKGMIEGNSGGTIVNIASMSARKCAMHTACYAASKAALENLTKTMALELGANNIRVNCILPGPVDAPMIDKSSIPAEVVKVVEDIVQSQVIKRMVNMDEIADLVLFLLSPLSSMIVGQGVVIDGGWSLS